MQHDVFISFSFKDYDMAQSIVNALQSKHGIRCWICKRSDSDADRIHGGDHYKAQIVDALIAAKVVVLVQSKDAFASREVPKEIGIAFDEDKLIIPFRLDDAKASGSLRYDLSGIDFIDGQVPTFDERIDELAAAIKRNLRQQAPADDIIPYGTLTTPEFACDEIFVGRDALIDSIHAAYGERNVVFLHGMGGIGKSEIAKQYAKRFRADYDTVVFARYTTSLAALIADDSIFAMSGLARRTRADNTQQTDEEYARDKLKALRASASKRTLLIIDNFDVTKDPLLQGLTGDCPYRVLITTRCKPETGKYHVIPVRELDDEALRAMVIAYADPEDCPLDPEDLAFPALLTLANRHTLTLELIARFISLRGLDDVGEAIELLQANGLSILGDSEDENGYQRIRDLFRLTALSDTELTFLRCLALMPPAGVEQKLFRQWCGDGYAARPRLMSLSLISIDPLTRRLSLHPVIREVIINELKPGYDNCREFIDRCAMVEDENASGTMWYMEYTAKLSLLQCFDCLIRMMPDITEANYPVFANMSYMYNYIGSFADAIALHERLYRFSCTHFGECSYQALLALNNIGWKQSNCMFFHDAVETLTKAAELFLASPYWQDKRSKTCLVTCIGVHIRLYEQTKVPALLERALHYLELAVGLGDEKYLHLTLSREYFKIYLLKGDLVQAAERIDEFEQAVDKYTLVPEAHQVDQITINHHRGSLLIKSGQYEEAIALLAKARDGYLKYFSSRNLRLLDNLKLLTQCHLHLGQTAEATRYADEALEIARALYTYDHPTRAHLRQLRSQC